MWARLGAAAGWTGRRVSGGGWWDLRRLALSVPSATYSSTSSSPSPYGFGAASGRDRVVWASGRPGGPLTPGGADAGLSSPACVNAWVDHVWAVAGENVRRVLVMLGEDEVRAYERPLLVHLFRHDFAVARVGQGAAAGGSEGETGTRVEGEGGGNADRLAKVLKALRTAEAAGEGVVAVCGDGGQRGAHACAAWLWYRYSLDPAEACAEVGRQAEADGCHARAAAAADVDAFRAFLGERTRESLYDQVDRHGLRDPPPEASISQT